MTLDLNALKRNVKTQVIKRWSEAGPYRVWPFDVSMDSVFDVYRAISDGLGTSGDRVSPEWDETFAEGAEIVLAERAQARAEADAERNNGR